MTNGNPEIPVRFPDGSEISGTTPIIIIGPNGSGKSQLAAQMQGLNNAHFISAQRHIGNLGQVLMSSLEDSKTQLRKKEARSASTFRSLSDDAQQVFAKLKAETSVRDALFTRSHKIGNPIDLESTTLDDLSDLWEEVFPGRILNTATHNFTVSSDLENNTPYSLSDMSDGERSTFLLAAKILNTECKVVIVDEPELFLHSRLAVEFWDAVERARDDCRFVYVTHDLSFALSRIDPTIVVKSSIDSDPTIIENGQLPSDLIDVLLKAGTFSIYAKRIVFCEDEDDAKLFSAWFKDRNTVVVPAHGCQRVIDSTKVFNETRMIEGVDAIGIIDRDYWHEAFLSSLPDEIHPLPVHELEGLLCMKPVFDAVASVTKVPEAEWDTRYKTACENARNHFKGAVLNKQILERFKCRIKAEQTRRIYDLRPDADLAKMKNTTISEWKNLADGALIEKLLMEEESTIRGALASSDVMDFLKVFPCKSFDCHFSQALGQTRDAYRRIVIDIIREDADGNLISALEGMLPSRTI